MDGYTIINLTNRYNLQKKDSTLWAWGENNYGQLCDGTDIDRWMPVQVLGLCDGISGINETSGYSLDIELFPNPSNGKFTIYSEIKVSSMKL